MTDIHYIGVGLPRTGTSSLKAALKILNLPKKNSHVGDHMVLPADRFKTMDRKYPDAKFILTVRESAEKWLSSVIKRTKVIEGNEQILQNRERMYGSRTVVPEIYLPVYWQREVAVTEYFQKKYHASWRDKLLVICWENNTSDENWRLLCDFLFMEIPDISFPHKNKSK